MDAYVAVALTVATLVHTAATGASWDTYAVLVAGLVALTYIVIARARA